MKGAAMGTSYRIPWDAEEMAVLVHGYMQLKNSVLFYNEAIKYVSHTLRERALRRGMNVGETFRNENGISMQMTKIEDIFSGGKFRLSPPPQVFFDVVQLYRKDRKAFNELLERATGASSDRAALEKGFFQWLANKVPPHILPNLQDACHKLNKFLSEYKVLDISLFDKNIIHVMDKVKSTVNSNEILHFLQQEKMSLMQTAIEFYYIYLIEAHDNDASHQPIDSPHEERPQPLPPLTEGCRVDFTEITTDQYVNTQPERLYYKLETYSVSVWATLYTLIARSIYKENPSAIKALCGKSLSGEGKRIDIADLSYRSKMRTPKEIADGLYLETHLSATNTVCKIKALLDQCRIDYSDVTITYTPRSKTASHDTPLSPMPQTQQPREGQPSSPAALSPAHEQEASIHESAEIRPDTSSTTSATTLALADPAQEVYMQSYHIPLSSAALVLGVLHSDSIADAYAASRSDTEGRMY